MRIPAADYLTLSRLAMAPIVVVLFAKGLDSWALIVFAIAGATDLIDGTVARLFGQSSIGGALLDPIADKVLIQSCFISLAVTGILPWWFAGLAFARDAMIIGGIVFLEVRHAPLPYRAAITSKIAMVLQLGVAMLGIAQHMRPGMALWGIELERALGVMLLLAACFIVLSGANYVVIGIRILRASRAAGKASA
jgi:cardiolipin synthase